MHLCVCVYLLIKGQCTLNRQLKGIKLLVALLNVCHVHMIDLGGYYLWICKIYFYIKVKNEDLSGFIVING